MTQFLPISNHAVTAIVSWAVETSLVAAVLAFVAYAAGRSRLLKLAPASRHALWTVVFLKFLIPPFIHWPWSTAFTPLGHSDAQHVMVDIHTAPRPIRPPNPFVLLAVSQSPTSLPSPTPIAPSETDVPDDGLDIEPNTNLPQGSPHREGASPLNLGQVLLGCWLAGSIVFGLRRAISIVNFNRGLRRARRAPAWLVEEAQELGRDLDAWVPQIRLVAGAGSPRLWCLGRPVLLVPDRLARTLSTDHWRCILAHELAHLKRKDHWLSRLEVLASLVWWWNPLFWLATRRIDAEAELACDAWVVGALPKARLRYAEALVHICASLSKAKLPVPSLGMAGAGRFVERRLTMVLHERVSTRMPLVAFLAAALLALLSAPGWLSAAPATSEKATSPVVVSDDDATTAAPDMSDDPDDPDDEADDDDDDADDEDDADADDDDDDDDAKPAKAKAKHKAEQDQKKVEERLEKEIEKSFGPEFEKKMEAMGEKIAKEMEAKFGPGSDFEKKMEVFAKDLEEKFGPEFEKKMEAFGKDIEKEFGPEFQKKMERFGKEMEEQFGPEFQKKMQAMGEDMAREFGEGSEFQNKMKDIQKLAAKAKKDAKAKKAKAEAEANDEAQPTAKRKNIGSKERAARIRKLERQIEALAAELERLRDADDDEQNEGGEEE